MKLLFLGGTGFVGKHMVEFALTRGHEVTLFNRNQTNTTLFPQAERLTGDRSGCLDALRGHAWDAVVDVNGYLPGIVEDSARLLNQRVGQYLFVSTASVYDPCAALHDGENISLDEGAALVKTDNLNAKEYWGESYGGLKVLCEDIVRKYYPHNSMILRLGVVAGPDDPTDRVTYWVARVAQGGEMLVPARPERQIQFIDVDDLAQFTIHVLENRLTGTLNATGRAITWQEWMNACNLAAGSKPTLHWIDDIDFLRNKVCDSVRPFGALPMMAAGNYKQTIFNSDRALALGLTYRSPEVTARSTLVWHRNRMISEDESALSSEKRVKGVLEWGTQTADKSWKAGLTPEQEANMLAVWNERAVK